MVALGHPPLIIMEIDMDIVEWLRTYGSEPSRLNEAADEIERLREALKQAQSQFNYWKKLALFTNSEAAYLQQKETE